MEITVLDITLTTTNVVLALTPLALLAWEFNVHLPRVETWDARCSSALAWCTPRVDQGQHLPRFLLAWPVAPQNHWRPRTPMAVNNSPLTTTHLVFPEKSRTLAQ